MSGLSRTPGKRVWVHSPPRVRIPPAPPKQVLLTCSAKFEGAQSPAPRGAFCYGLLTALQENSPETRLKPSFVSEPPDFFVVVRQEGGGEKSGFWRRTN